MKEVAHNEAEAADGEGLVEVDTALSANRAEYYRHHYELSSNQLTDYAKWLNASLLAINGAGTIAILNAFTKISNHGTVAAFFVTGLMAALLSGWLLQFFYLKISSLTSLLWLYWKDAESTGRLNSKDNQEAEGKIERIAKFSWIPPFFGWISAISFLIGVALFIINLKSRS